MTIIGIIFFLLLVIPFFYITGQIRWHSFNGEDVWVIGTRTRLIFSVCVAFSIVAYTNASLSQYVSKVNVLMFATPTPAATKTPLPTKTPIPTKTMTPTSQPECVYWNDVTAADEGKFLCVYGRVIENFYDESDEYYGVSYMIFGNGYNDFSFIDSDYYYTDIRVGECIEGSGFVEVYDNAPFIDPNGALFSSNYCGVENSNG